MIDKLVGVRAKISSYRELINHVVDLPEPFRPSHFSLGGRIQNKELDRIENRERFEDFLNRRLATCSWFDLVGAGLTFGFFTTETRTANNDPTHVACSVSLRGRRWSASQLDILMRTLCAGPGIERAYACRRDEWESRHLNIKELGESTIESSLGVDMSAYCLVYTGGQFFRRSLLIAIG